MAASCLRRSFEALQANPMADPALDFSNYVDPLHPTKRSVVSFGAGRYPKITGTERAREAKIVTATIEAD